MPSHGPSALLPWVLFVPLAVLNYLPSLKWMAARWMEDNSYTSHGPLIPLISLGLIGSLRPALVSAMGPGSPSGLLVVLFALAVHALAGLADISSLSGFTMAPLLAGFLALLHGWRFFQVVWFPLAFLLCMVPPPEFVISTLNFSLKLMAADTAEWLLNLSGVPAVRQGSFMFFGSEKLAIGDVCSGLRSLLSLLALSTLYAWLIRDRGKLQVAGVLLAALPAAIIGNGVRICLVSYLVLWLGKDKVFKPLLGSWDLHLFTGSVIFAAALACLWGITALIDRLTVARKERPPLRKEEDGKQE